jgi:hypothetical protein
MPSLPLQIVVDPQQGAEQPGLQQQQEELVYHYTSADALLKIVTKRRFWLTSTEFVNDTFEFSLPTRRLLHMAQHSAITIPWVPPNTPVAHLQALGLHLGNSMFTYVACFSRSANSLSQFRLYGQGGGYAIGFPRSFLQRVAVGLSTGKEPTEGVATVADCNYSPEALEKFCQHYASDFLHEAEKIDKERNKTPQQIWNDIYAQTRLFNSRLLAQIAFKSHHFAVEQEVRLVKYGHLGNVKRCWRPSRAGSYIVPYLEIELPNEPVIVALQSGPSLDAELAGKSVREAVYAALHAETKWQFSMSSPHDSGFRVGL